MRLSIWKKATVFLAGLMLLSSSATGSRSMQKAALPQPMLVFMGREDYEASGKKWTRYKYTVANLTAYPNEMFAPAPDLPPCGQNTKASRTWADLYADGGKRLNGFCALGNHDGLSKLWFSLERDVIPPSWVYLELNDRKTNTKYKSMLTETTE